jgi:hypothetical protein
VGGGGGGLLGGGEKGQGGDVTGGGVPVRCAYAKTTSSKKPRQANKTKLHADPDCLTCTRATRANPHRHSPGNRKTNGAILNPGVSHHIIQTPTVFRADLTYGLASQPTCPDRASDRSALRDLKSHPNRRSGFEQPKRQEEEDKHMTKPDIRASEVPCCYLIFASIEGMCGSNGAPFSTSYLGDTADIIFGYGAGTLITHIPTTRHARVSEVRPSDAARDFAGGR